MIILIMLRYEAIWAQVELRVPLDIMPIFVQPGAVMELLPPEVNTLLTSKEVLGGFLDDSVVPLGAARILQVSLLSLFRSATRHYTVLSNSSQVA